MVNNTDKWDSVASSIEKTVDEAYKQFKGLEHETIEARPEPTAWSVKEIVGHLVDSASNNLHRIVHLQISDGLVFPDYSQNNNAWVSIQEYQEAPWDDMLALWRLLNHHLARTIRAVNEQCIDHIWIIDEDTTITLAELIIDYPRHLKGHLRQIREYIDGN